MIRIESIKNYFVQQTVDIVVYSTYSKVISSLVSLLLIVYDKWLHGSPEVNCNALIVPWVLYEQARDRNYFYYIIYHTLQHLHFNMTNPAFCYSLSLILHGLAITPMSVKNRTEWKFIRFKHIQLFVRKQKYKYVKYVLKRVSFGCKECIK